MTETGADDEIYWTEEGAPRSRRFDDVFFSDGDGLAESRHVFLGGVDLAELLQGGGTVRIGEIGFGLGLNFLAAWSALTDAPDARFDYIGFERRPPNAEEIRRALALWPELDHSRDALLRAWPLLDGAPTSIGARATLTLHVGEAIARIDRLRSPRDVWWLDGFSPAKNPEAWDPALLAKIYARTAPGGRLATYAAAGWVRRGLAAAGFEVTRAPGFGTKKEMLTARRPDG